MSNTELYTKVTPIFESKFYLNIINFYFIYFKDTRVWIPDPDKVWKAGRLLENYDPRLSNLKILIEDDNIVI